MRDFMDFSNLPNFYSHSVSYNQNDYLNLIQFGRDVSSPGFSYPQYQNAYIIYYIKSGKGILETQGKKYSLSKNNAFVIQPNELAIQTADKKNPWELYFFSFNGTLAHHILNRTIFKNGSHTVSLKENSFPEEIVNAVNYSNYTPHSVFTMLEFLFKFISYFDIYKSVPQQKSENSEQKYVAEIKKYIQSNYLTQIKISDIADRLNINRSHLYRIFKAETGMSVEDYIINIRITQAKFLLTDTLLPVAQISSLVGYKNYTTFYKMFKRITGTTPLEYRKNKSKNDAYEQYSKGQSSRVK